MPRPIHCAGRHLEGYPAVPYVIPLIRLLSIHLAGRDSSIASAAGLRFDLQTDSLGKFERAFAVPPLKKSRSFHGVVVAQKVGYERSVVAFRHASVDSVVCLINMVRSR